jgi:transposase-like protein
MAKRVRKSDPAKERYWRAVVQGYEGSGQSVREYCRQAGVKESAFYWWRRELARRGSGRNAARQRTNSMSRQSGTVARRKTAAQRPGGKSPPFLPIRVWADRTAAVPADHAAAVEIHLGDGRMVRVGPGVDRQTFVDVLTALEARSC